MNKPQPLFRKNIVEIKAANPATRQAIKAPMDQAVLDPKTEQSADHTSVNPSNM